MLQQVWYSWKQKTRIRGLQQRLGSRLVSLLGGFWLLGVWSSQPVSAQTTAVHGYYQYPTVHGETVVFCAEGDLWKASLQGGMAQRLTSHPGPEMMPQFSPDGRWIAFSAVYGGDLDVYIIPSQGGVPKRLTYRAGPDLVVGWTPDSQSVVFRTLRVSPDRHWRLFTINISGKTMPQRLPIGYGSIVTFSPDGKQVAFTRYAREMRNWKRYTGGWAQDIWVGSLAQREYRKITAYPGTDAHPMWYKDRIYFVSDRTGNRNLFSIDPITRKIWQHTFHKTWDVLWPSLGGHVIVYQLGADVWSLDLHTQVAKKIALTLPTDTTQRLSRWVSAGSHVSVYDVSPDGKRLLLNSRGDLFNVAVGEGVTLRITQTSGQREKFASFSPDGKQVIAMSDQSGEDEVVLFDALGEKPAKVITRGGKAWRFWPAMSPDQKSVAFADKNLKLWIASIKTGELQLVSHAKTWEIRTYQWSPDSRYLAYVQSEPNQFRSIFLYDTKTKKTIRATRAWTDDFDPAWSPDGKLLYFLSRREIKPFIGTFDFTDTVDESTKVYALILAKAAQSPFVPQDAWIQARNQEEQKSKTDKSSTKPAADQAKTKASSQPTTSSKTKNKRGKKAKDKKAKASKDSPTCPKGKVWCKTTKQCKDDKKKKPVQVQVDEDGLLDRVYEVPGIPEGHYFGLNALADRLLVMSHPTFKMGGQRDYLTWRKQIKLWAYLIKTKKLSLLTAGVSGYALSSNLKFLALRRGPTFRVMPASAMKEPKDPKTLVNAATLPMEIQPAAEWKQIFLEAWRLQRDFFWATNLASIDWASIRDRYLNILDRILTRTELNTLIGEMIAELGTSHTYVWGGDQRRFASANNGVLGADLALDPKSGFYRIAKIYRGAPWSQESASPLTAHHLKVTEGTYLLAIDGQPVRSTDNYYQFLQNRAGQLVSLTVHDKPSFTGARRVVVKTLGWWNERGLRYVDWVESRRKLTLALSQGKVGYIHLPDMSGAGLIAFYKMWYPQLHMRAMVIDVRGNGGGFVSQLIIQKLMRKIWAFFKPRNSPMSETVPDRTFHGHAAVVTNATSGSDGDIFCKSFQLNKLGPVFGTRTWGGVVGIRADKQFVDGGMTTQPEFAWWTPSIGWDLENSGITPDVTVDNTPTDEEREDDKQLKAAVSYLLQQLKKDPKNLPALPAYPNKSIDAFRKRMKLWQVPPAPRPNPKPTQR